MRTVYRSQLSRGRQGVLPASDGSTAAIARRWCRDHAAGGPGPGVAPAPSGRTYLQQVRGFAPSTVTHHGRTAGEFLAHIGYEEHPTRLAALDRQELDTFLCAVAPRQSRASLQHVVGHLRAFLRFLAADGEIPTGLDTQIDTPRVYRGEQLPRALPWDTVRALLHSIARSTPLGRRDYAIFLLMATYGLRACEVVTLALDDGEWRAGRLRIPQRKTRGSLWLPLTDEAGTALFDYLRHGRAALNVRRQGVPFRGAPPRSYRELFSAAAPRPASSNRRPSPRPSRLGRSEAASPFRSREPIACGTRMRCTCCGRACRSRRSGTSWAIAPWKARACTSAWRLMTSAT